MSQIDTTIPEDGTPSVKPKFRQNWEIIARENDALTARVSSLEQRPPGGGGGSSSVLVVTSFGAKGDNVADDTAAIQATINALPTRGGIVFFPRGIYRTTGTITIPTIHNGGLKPVRLEGENANAIDGGVTGWAGGASAIHYVGSGTCIDASGGTRVNSLNPRWSGSIRDLAIHNGGSGQIGIHINSPLSCLFYNVLTRGFAQNWRIDGELFYSIWVNVQSYRGQMTFGGAKFSTGNGTVFNGAVFFNCHFSEAGNVPAVLIGEYMWPGQMIKFQHCYWEQNDNVAISAKIAYTLYLDQCYFESNNLVGGNAEVYFEGIGGGYSEIVLDKCYHRMTMASKALVEVRGGNANSEPLVSILHNKVSAEKSGQVAVLGSAGSPARPSIIAIGNRTLNRSQRLPIFSGTLGQLQAFNATDCRFTEAASIGAAGSFTPKGSVQ